MKPFSRLYTTESQPVNLVWRQPRFGADAYELCDDPPGEALYAAMSWPKWLSDLAVAGSAAGTWHFDRLGWLRGTVVATQVEVPAAYPGVQNQTPPVRIANFEIGWLWEGDIILNSGKIFHWYRTKTFQNAWALTEVILDDQREPLYSTRRSPELVTQEKSGRIEQVCKRFHIHKQPKPAHRERLVYEIEFGLRRFKQEAWITLPNPWAYNAAELTFLLCAGMYLGYCYNQDNAAAVAASTTVAVC